MEEVTYRLSYSSRHSDTRSTIMDLDISFENPTENDLKNRINIWLTAIGSNLEIVAKSKT